MCHQNGFFFFKLTIHMSVISACLNSYLLLLNQHRSYGSIFFFYFGMSQIFLVIQSLHPFETFCLWAVMIAIYVSVAICQLPIRQSLGKRLLAIR